MLDLDVEPPRRTSPQPSEEANGGLLWRQRRWRTRRWRRNNEEEEEDEEEDEEEEEGSSSHSEEGTGEAVSEEGDGGIEGSINQSGGAHSGSEGSEGSENSSDSDDEDSEGVSLDSSHLENSLGSESTSSLLPEADDY